jgi:cobalamin biosynthesis protein CobD/CbiB
MKSAIPYGNTMCKNLSTMLPTRTNDSNASSTSGKRFPLLRTMFSAFGSTLIAPVLPCIIYALASITQPILITHVIKFVESYQTGNSADQQPVAHGWGLVAAYALVFLTSTLSWSMFQMAALRSSVAMRGLLVQMVYPRLSRYIRIQQKRSEQGLPPH